MLPLQTKLLAMYQLLPWRWYLKIQHAGWGIPPGDKENEQPWTPSKAVYVTSGFTTAGTAKGIPHTPDTHPLCSHLLRDGRDERELVISLCSVTHWSIELRECHSFCHWFEHRLTSNIQTWCPRLSLAEEHVISTKSFRPQWQSGVLFKFVMSLCAKAKPKCDS